MEVALEQGRNIGVSPATQQMLEIRAMQKIGYKFEPNDLRLWQWRTLIEIDNAIEGHRAQELEKAIKK